VVFKVSRTFDQPSVSQTGMPAPGAGAQTTGPASLPSVESVWQARRPTQGLFSWLFPSSPASAQRGYDAPLSPSERRPAGSMPAAPPIWGGVYQHWTPYYDRGAAAYVPNFGKQLTNPIGAGIVARHMPQPSYGLAAQYANGALWWTSQVVPTSINLQGLTDPQELAAILDGTTIEAVVRTTG